MNKALIVLIDQYNQELIKENYLIYFSLIYQNYLVALTTYISVCHHD